MFSKLNNSGIPSYDGRCAAVSQVLANAKRVCFLVILIHFFGRS